MLRYRLVGPQTAIRCCISSGTETLVAPGLTPFEGTGDAPPPSAIPALRETVKDALRRLNPKPPPPPCPPTACRAEFLRLAAAVMVQVSGPQLV